MTVSSSDSCRLSQRRAPKVVRPRESKVGAQAAKAGLPTPTEPLHSHQTSPPTPQPLRRSALCVHGGSRGCLMGCVVGSGWVDVCLRCVLDGRGGGEELSVELSVSLWCSSVIGKVTTNSAFRPSEMLITFGPLHLHHTPSTHSSASGSCVSPAGRCQNDRLCHSRVVAASCNR